MMELAVTDIDELVGNDESKPGVFSSIQRNPDCAKPAVYAPMDINRCMIHEGTEDELECRAYRETAIRTILYFFLVFITLGFILLIFYWKPNWKVRVRCAPCSFELASQLIIRDYCKQNHVRRIKQLYPATVTNFKQTDKISENGFKKIMEDASKPYCSLTQITKHGLHPTFYFEHKFLKYLWNGDTFLPLRGFDFDTTVHNLHEMEGGLSENEKPNRRILFGWNSITVPITPWFILLFRETVHPFYAFQVFAIIVWCVDEYYTLPAVIVLFAAISISLSLYLTRKQNRLIHKMSAGSGPIQVLVNGNFETRDSTDLLPGDIIRIEANQDTVWCDCVLLTGSCVVSESMLTGESVPVLKTPLTSDDPLNEYYDQNCHRQHTLYGGTKVLDAYPDQDDAPPRAVVTKTGFYTEKGRMIESMVSPSPMDYKIYSDSLKFILVMAMIGFIGCILTVFFLARLNADAGLIVKRVLDLITIVVPPGLPAALTIATIYAQRRLSKAQIFCISPPRISLSGKINCMCFDKTGTLTENDLKLWGVVPCLENKQGEETETLANGRPKFAETVHDYGRLSEYDEAGLKCLHALASCNSLVNVNGEITGDAVDLELFRATNWIMKQCDEDWCKGCGRMLTSGDQTNVKLAVARVFQFNSAMRRMSVVTKKQGEERLRVYVKGAPETIVQQCKATSVPDNFDEKLRFFTRQGYRVLALATRTLDSAKTIDNLERRIVESELDFVGLAVMTNPLQSGTADTIDKLNVAHVRTVMATGDNLETAIHVARKCNMVQSMDKIVVVKARPSTATEEVKLSWELQPCDNDDAIVKASSFCSDKACVETPRFPTYHLAMTGETMNIIRTHSMELFFRVLMSATVLARMKPEHKKHLVEGLQQMKYFVGMCGDGANDCGALKAAHSGIAIAEVEASIVAPFTSMKKDISCCIKLIREGRAALVTSFGMIKYLCIYCFVQYLSLIFLYTVNSYISDIQFLLADICICGIVIGFFAFGGASKILAKKQPHQSLVSAVMLSCLFMQIIVIILVQLASFLTLQNQPWYTPLVSNMTDPKLNIVSSENTVLFYTSSFQNIVLAFVLYEAGPHKQPLYRNVPYFVGILLLMILVAVLFFVPVEPLASTFSLTTLNYDLGFKLMLLAYYVVNLIFAIIVEKVLLQSKSFERFLNKIAAKFHRFRRTDVDISDRKGKVRFRDLRRELILDAMWPPVGQETTLKV